MSEVTNKIGAVICADCKKKLEDLVKNLTGWDKLRPLKTANKFLNALCPDCKIKAVNITRKQ